MSSTLNFSARGYEPPSTDLSVQSSRYTREMVETVFYAGVGTLKCLLGVSTNGVNCLVFCRQGLQDRMNVCLFSLALVDFLYFMIIFLLFPLATFIRFCDIFLYEEYYAKMTVALVGVANGFSLTSGCITMAIAIDTCVCVVFPHRAASIMRTKTMTSLLIFSFLFIQVCYVIFPLSYTYLKITVANRTQWVIRPTSLHEANKLVFYLFQNIALEMAIPFINVAIISVSTILTVKRLKSGIKWRQTTSNITNNLIGQQVALINMLTTVACVYVAIMLPCIIFQISLWFTIRTSANRSVQNHVLAASAVILMFSHINSCLNFFIYYRRSSRFRRDLHNCLSE